MIIDSELSNLVIVPDVHGRRFWRDAVGGREGDKIIFLGDYVDPYGWEGISPSDAYEELLDIIAFKKEHNDVVLLLGNHDLGYLDPAICSCRRDYCRAGILRELFEAELDLFDIVHVEEKGGRKFLFTHAGIAEDWVRLHADIAGSLDEFMPERLNGLLHGNLSERGALFRSLAEVSWFRGGPDEVGSPVWADVNEYLVGECLVEGYTHIFGHTLHDGGPVSVSDSGFCLDCARAFTLNQGNKLEML